MGQYHALGSPGRAGRVDDVAHCRGTHSESLLVAGGRIEVQSVERRHRFTRRRFAGREDDDAPKHRQRLAAVRKTLPSWYDFV